MAWVRVWHYLHEAPVSDNIKVIWYRAKHYIHPTHVWLHRLNMAPCPLCGHSIELMIFNTAFLSVEKRV